MAVRTLRVAAQYIQYRKDRDARPRSREDPMSHETYSQDRPRPGSADEGTVVLRNVVPSATNTRRAAA